MVNDALGAMLCRADQGGDSRSQGAGGKEPLRIMRCIESAQREAASMLIVNV